MAEQWQQNHHISAQPTRLPPVCREEGTVSIGANLLSHKTVHTCHNTHHTFATLSLYCWARSSNSFLCNERANREHAVDVSYYKHAPTYTHAYYLHVTVDPPQLVSFFSWGKGTYALNWKKSMYIHTVLRLQRQLVDLQSTLQDTYSTETTHNSMHIHYIPFPHLRYVPHLDQVDESAGKILFYLHQRLIQVLLIVISCQVREIPRATTQYNYIIIHCTIFYMGHLPQAEVICTN